MVETPPTTRSSLRELIHPPMRADARRNYEALLVAADEAFSAHGPDASLDEIARNAGVGNATLYRHFPTRRDLLVAVCIGEVEALCTLGERLQSHSRPGEALKRWLRAYIEHVSSKGGLATAFATGRREDSEFVTTCQDAVQRVGSTLLANAQRDRAIRTDVDIADVITLVNAIAMASETQGVRGATRLLDLVHSGIARRD